MFISTSEYHCANSNYLSSINFIVINSLEQYTAGHEPIARKKIVTYYHAGHTGRYRVVIAAVFNSIARIPSFSEQSSTSCVLSPISTHRGYIVTHKVKLLDINLISSKIMLCRSYIR